MRTVALAFEEALVPTAGPALAFTLTAIAVAAIFNCRSSDCEPV